MTTKSFKAKEKGLVFEADFNAIQGKQYIGDPTRIRQVLMNLCGNAIKFTAKGTIKLHLSTQPGAKAGYENVIIKVIDTGIGIPADKLEQIFEKFTQADATITRRYGGTGLGLAITKNLVEIMDGTIQVESMLGEGAIFTVTIPLLLNAQEKMFVPVAPVEKIEVKAGQDQLRVLLVEDYKPNTIVAGTFLEEFGYKYDVAENGHQAVQKFIENQYDAVLMDVQMPGMDGYQATQAIRKYEKERGLKPVKIIGLTAHASLKDRDKCMEVGMNDYLPKPFDLKKLQEKLQSDAA